MNLRETILNSNDIPVEQVAVPEWGVTVEVRGMDGTSRADWLERAFDAEGGKPDFRRIHPELVIACTYDPASGERVFQAADRDALNGKSAAATERIAKAALRLSGLDQDAVPRGKDA